MKKPVDNTFSAEILAAFLDGNATAQESDCIIQSLAEDAQLRELMHISQAVDKELGLDTCSIEILPMTALAANCDDENHCKGKADPGLMA